MDSSSLIYLLLFVAALCYLGTGIAAFRKYSVTQSDRLFIAGASMIIAAIGIASSITDIVPLLEPYGFEWAWYTGTFCCYLLLFLSSIMKSDEQFRALKHWSIIVGVVVLIMVMLSLILPDISTNRNVIVLFNILRVAICSLGLLRYLTLYTSKGGTRFCLLLCLTFLFLAVGYVTIIAQTFGPVLSVDGITVVNSTILLVGDIFLFVTFVAG